MWVGDKHCGKKQQGQGGGERSLRPSAKVASEQRLRWRSRGRRDLGLRAAGPGHIRAEPGMVLGTERRPV